MADDGRGSICQRRRALVDGDATSSGAEWVAARLGVSGGSGIGEMARLEP